MAIILLSGVSQAQRLPQKHKGKHSHEHSVKKHKKEKKLRKKSKKLRRNNRAKRTEGEFLVRFKKTVKGNLKGTRKTKKLKNRLALVEFDESKREYSDITDSLKQDQDIDLIEPNLLVKSLGHGHDHERKYKSPQNKIKKHLKRIKKLRKKRKKGRKGKTLKVGILDTGLDFNHPDLEGRTGPGVNLLYNSEDTTKTKESQDNTEMDYNGHGTMVAGVVAANDNDFGITGLDQEVKVFGIKAFDENGIGYLSEVIQGIEWAIEHKIDILNMSFGTYQYSALLEEVVNRARATGMILIASSGNDYSGDAMYPGRYEEVLCVGSHDESHWISRFSNWGPDVDIYALGKGLRSTNTSVNNKNPYSGFTGTSAATAFVTGVAAFAINEKFSKKGFQRKLKNYVSERYSIHSPTEDPHKELNVEKLMNDLNGEELQQFEVTQLTTQYNMVQPDEAITIEYVVENTGLKKIKSVAMELHIIVGEKSVAVPVDNIKKLKVNGVVKNSFQIMLKDHLNDSVLINDFTPVHLKMVSPNKSFIDNNELSIFATEKVYPKVLAFSMWLNYEQNEFSILLRNTGNKDLKDVNGQIDIMPYFHERPDAYFLQQKLNDFSFDIKKGERKIVTVPVKLDSVLHWEKKLTIDLTLKKDDRVLSRYRDNHNRLEDGTYVVQYAQNVHRKIVKDAVALLIAEINKMGNIDLLPDEIKNGLMIEGDIEQYALWPRSNVSDAFTSSDLNESLIPEYFTKDYLQELKNKYIAPSHTSTWESRGGTQTYTSPDYYNFTKMNMLDGASDCDEWDVAYGFTTEDVFDSHFWIVDNDDGDGLNSSFFHSGYKENKDIIDFTQFLAGLLLTNETENHPSAMNKINVLMNGNSDKHIMNLRYNKLQNGAIQHFEAGKNLEDNIYLQGAYWLLGQAIHLIGDLSVPSHVNDENVHGLTGSAYHDWMDKHVYDWDFELAKSEGIVNPYKYAKGDEIRFLAYSTAQIANRFPWVSTAKTDNDGLLAFFAQEGLLAAKTLTSGENVYYMGKGGNPSLGGDSPHYENSFLNDFNSLPEHPRGKRDLNKDEVKDFAVAKWGWVNGPLGTKYWGPYVGSQCEEVDIVFSGLAYLTSFEEYNDCWGGGDGHTDHDNTDNGGNDDDGDLSTIRDVSYTYAVRAAAGLIYYFLVETDQIDRDPNMPVEIIKNKELAPGWHEYIEKVIDPSDYIGEWSTQGEDGHYWKISGEISNSMVATLDSDFYRDITLSTEIVNASSFSFYAQVQHGGRLDVFVNGTRVESVDAFYKNDVFTDIQSALPRLIQPSDGILDSKGDVHMPKFVSVPISKQRNDIRIVFVNDRSTVQAQHDQYAEYTYPPSEFKAYISEFKVNSEKCNNTEKYTSIGKNHSNVISQALGIDPLDWTECTFVRADQTKYIGEFDYTYGNWMFGYWVSQLSQIQDIDSESGVSPNVSLKGVAIREYGKTWIQTTVKNLESIKLNFLNTMPINNKVCLIIDREEQFCKTANDWVDKSNPTIFVDPSREHIIRIESEKSIEASEIEVPIITLDLSYYDYKIIDEPIDDTEKSIPISYTGGLPPSIVVESENDNLTFESPIKIGNTDNKTPTIDYHWEQGRYEDYFNSPTNILIQNWSIGDYLYIQSPEAHGVDMSEYSYVRFAMKSSGGVHPVAIKVKDNSGGYISSVIEVESKFQVYELPISVPGFSLDKKSIQQLLLVEPLGASTQTELRIDDITYVKHATNKHIVVQFGTEDVTTKKYRQDGSSYNYTSYAEPYVSFNVDLLGVSNLGNAHGDVIVRFTTKWGSQQEVLLKHSAGRRYYGRIFGLRETSFYSFHTFEIEYEQSTSEKVKIDEGSYISTPEFELAYDVTRQLNSVNLNEFQVKIINVPESSIKSVELQYMDYYTCSFTCSSGKTPVYSWASLNQFGDGQLDDSSIWQGFNMDLESTSLTSFAFSLIVTYVDNQKRIYEHKISFLDESSESCQRDSDGECISYLSKGIILKESPYPIFPTLDVNAENGMYVGNKIEFDFAVKAKTNIHVINIDYGDDTDNSMSDSFENYVEQQFSHSYSSPGAYTVSICAADHNANIGCHEIEIEIFDESLTHLYSQILGMYGTTMNSSLMNQTLMPSVAIQPHIMQNVILPMP